MILSRILKGIKDFGANLMISIDFGANLGFGARIRARTSFKTSQSTKMSILDFRIFRFRIFGFSQNPNHFFF